MSIACSNAELVSMITQKFKCLVFSVESSSSRIQTSFADLIFGNITASGGHSRSNRASRSLNPCLVVMGLIRIISSDAVSCLLENKSIVKFLDSSFLFNATASSKSIQTISAGTLRAFKNISGRSPGTNNRLLRAFAAFSIFIFISSLKK